MKFSLIPIGLLVMQLVSSSAATTNAFVEAGIPASSREWLGSDYTLAAKILSAGKVALPRFSEAQGNVLLRRLTSTENFPFYRNSKLPIESRISDFANLLDGANLILLLYVKAANKGEDVHKEAAHMMAFLLHTGALGTELIDQFMPTIPRDDKYSIRMDGLKKMRTGMTGLFVGAENSLSERTYYSSDDLSVLLQAMVRTLPRIKTAFSADYRAELRKKLESHKSRFKSRDDLGRLDKMLVELDS